jgi:hypothetical protein
VVLYEMLTGRPAFNGASQASLLGAILKDEPPPVSQVQPVTPPALDHLVRTCLAKDPDARFQAAHDVLLQLRWIAEGSGAVAAPALVQGRTGRLLWTVAALGLGVLAAGPRSGGAHLCRPNSTRSPVSSLRCLKVRPSAAWDGTCSPCRLTARSSPMSPTASCTCGAWITSSRSRFAALAKTRCSRCSLARRRVARLLRTEPGDRRVGAQKDPACRRRPNHARFLSTAAPGTIFSAWSGDGRTVLFRRVNTLVWASTDGSGRGGPVPGAQANDFPSGAGADNDSFLVTRIQPDSMGDIFLVSISGAFEPRPLIATRAYEGGAQLSPDGRWLTYVSDASGWSEILVRPYPALERQWQVSEGAGIQPRWSRDGREIFYRDGTSLVAVPFNGARAEPVIGKPVPLFQDDYEFGQGITIANYDVAPEGRWIFLRRESQAGTLRVVLNWTEELTQVLAGR